MKAYWDNLNQREQWMLAVGAVFCVLCLMYLLIMAPLLNAVHSKTQQLREKQEALLWMRKAHQQHRNTKILETISTSKLLSVLSDQLKSTSFHAYPYQLQQTGTGDIHLSFTEVPYNAFLTWLWDLSQHYVFSMKQLNIERTDTPGVAKVAVTFIVN